MSRTNFRGSNRLDAPSKIADLVATASAGTKDTPDGAVSVNFTTPTVASLAEYCVELEDKLNKALAVMRANGLITD